MSEFDSETFKKENERFLNGRASYIFDSFTDVELFFTQYGRIYENQPNIPYIWDLITHGQAVGSHGGWLTVFPNGLNTVTWKSNKYSVELI